MKKLLLLLALIATGYLFYHALVYKSKDIEADITTRLTQSFQSQNISDNVAFTVSGRDVTLTGDVAEQIDRAEVGRLASSLVGVRVVDNQINVVAPAPVVLKEPEPLRFPDPIPEPIADPTIVLSGSVDVVEQSDIDPTIMFAEPMVVEPEIVLEPVVELEAPVIVEQPVIVANDVTLDKPLSVQNGRIIRRGVDYVTAQKTVEAACEYDLTSLLHGNKINFDSGRATIKSKSYNLLDRMVVAAKNCDSGTIITINGYTDNVGNFEANRKLSLRRARAVGQYMLKRGVAKKVKVVGHGSNDPIADNDTEEGRAQNRRIEFKVYTK